MSNATPNLNHFEILPHEGEGIDTVARAIANDALRSGRPDHYATLFARAIQIICMHKVPHHEFYGCTPEELRELEKLKAENEVRGAADRCARGSRHA
jgi:hypothetical protein